MKSIKSLLAVLLVALTAAGFSSCKDDNDGPEMPYIYLDYRLEVLDNGIVNAFANFLSGYPSGQRLRLTGGATLTVNGKNLQYFKSDPSQINTFDYSNNITSTLFGDRSVSFVFRHSSGDVVTTDITLSSLPEFSIPDYKDIQNGKFYSLMADGSAPAGNARFKVQLISSRGDVVDAVEGMNYDFSFSGVPAGVYTLRYIQMTTYRIPASTGIFGGSLEVWNVKTRASVNVK